MYSRPFAWIFPIAVALLPGPIGLQRLAAQEDPAILHAKALSRAFRKAAEATVPTVVKITTESKPRTAQGGGRRQNPFRGTPFEGLFSEEMQRRMEQMPNREGVGSGVIIDPSGIVLTNNHVVEGADKVRVFLNDGRDFEAVDIKFDAETDLAVLHLSDAKNLPAAKLGNSDNLDVGDWVIAVGNPFELETTVSAGIISAKGRTIGSVRRGRFLQTDAAINPGNSGGPLVNLDGEVVGINTAIASNSGGYQGIGFAIPINTATWVTNQLVKTGKVQRAYLGVSIAEVTDELAQQFKLRRGEGVLVQEVYPETPAADAGLEEGDVILRFSGQPVAGPRELQELVERSPANSQQKLQVVREGRQMALDIAMKVKPDDFGVQARPVRGPLEIPDGEAVEDSRLGFEVSELTKEVSDRLGYSSFKGVLVSNVDEQGVAYDRGLRVGMLIMKVGKRAVATVEEFQAAMKAESLREGVLLLVRAGSSNRFIVLDDQR
jgi:serine protease Do